MHGFSEVEGGLSLLRTWRKWAPPLSDPLLTSTALSDIFAVDQKKWNKEERPLWSGADSLIVGEWWKFDCGLRTSKVNATLWQSKTRANFPRRQRIPDGKYLKVLDQNIFLISGLKRSDGGSYFCEACGLRKFVGALYMIGKYKDHVPVYIYGLQLCRVHLFTDHGTEFLKTINKLLGCWL